MRKMNRKVVSMLLAVCMLMGLLSGCKSESGKDTGKQSDVTTSTGKPAEGTPTEKPEEEKTGYNGTDNLQVSEEPVTLTLFYPFTALGAPTPDLPVWKEIANITNVTIENVANASISDAKESMNTMLVSGTLPDLIQNHKMHIEPLIDQGAFLPLDDLIAEHGPNIQKFLKNYPEAVDAGTGSDGKMYLLSNTLGGEPGETLPSMGMFIRKDWLKKLELKEPATFEELRNVLYAFRNNDPNGNGQKDEVPLFGRQGTWPLLMFWGITNDWMVQNDSAIVHGRATAEYKQALKDLAQWYKDGVLDPEIFTRGSQARQFLIGNDLGGVTIDWFGSTAAVNDAAREMVPDVDFAAMLPPANYNGVVEMPFGRAPIGDFRWGISKDCKDPVAAVEFMDFFYSDTGRVLYAYGIEGTDYTMENGVPAPTEHAKSFEGGYMAYLRSIGASLEVGSYGNLAGDLYAMNDIGKEGFNLYLDNSQLIKKQFPILKFSEEERKSIDDVMPIITTKMDEYEQGVLLGTVDLETTWEKHLSELNEMGLQAATEAQNAAYIRYLQK